jgi:hypothetical protein
MKIALSGSAGTGRSTIAIRLAQSIAHSPLTNLAKGILREHGFKYGTDMTVEQFLATPERQRQLYDHKRVVESKYDNFVTDRSWIDNAAYAVVGLHKNMMFDMASYVDDCKSEVEKYDCIIHIPWGRQPLQPNGTRTINPWFQFMVDSVICNMAKLWQVNLTTVPQDLSNKECVEWILKFLKKENSELEIVPIKEEAREEADS